MKRIITHDGVFHTDEVFAVAWLQLLFPNTPVTRTRMISNEDYLDTDAIIVDVGYRYEHGYSNYDHHQNDEQVNDKSAFGLIFKHYPEVIRKEFTTPESQQFVIKNLNENLVKPIDDWDNGLVKESNPQLEGVIPLQQVFRWMNVDIADSKSQDYVFGVAVYIAQQIIRGAMNSAHRAHDAHIVWNKRKKLRNGQIITFDNFCMIWKNKAVKEDTIPLFAIWREDEATYTVAAFDTKICNIVDFDVPSRIFRHKSGFLAKYSNMTDAIQTAMLSLDKHLLK